MKKKFKKTIQTKIQKKKYQKKNLKKKKKITTNSEKKFLKKVFQKKNCGKQIFPKKSGEKWARRAAIFLVLLMRENKQKLMRQTAASKSLLVTANWFLVFVGSILPILIDQGWHHYENLIIDKCDVHIQVLLRAHISIKIPKSSLIYQHD